MSHHEASGGTGAGPTLSDPGDSIQRSDTAYSNHLNDASHAVGGGPSLRNKPSQHEEAHLTDSQARQSMGDTSVTQREIDHHSTLQNVRAKIGLQEDAPILEGHEVHHNLAWSSVRVVLREPFAEFFGVFIMILFGNGSVAQVLLSTGQTTAPGGDGFGSYQSISWGWGLGVMLGIYVAGDSGGFLNPAVTFAFCLFRKLPWKRFPIYFLAQVLGGFVGSGVVYANYISAIDKVNGHGIRTVPPAEGATAGTVTLPPFLPSTGY